MKTISLSDQAYERLRSWKKTPKESFSRIVLRVVPKRGTLSDLATEIDKLPALTDEQEKSMEEALNWANDWKNYRDSWTT
jgi:predicted CopG family antitoxin